MTYLNRHRILATVTATGGGAQAFYTPVAHGYLESVVYKRGTTATTTSGISTNANITIIADQSLNVMLTCSATESRTFQPRMNIESSLGATVAGFNRFPIANERIKVQFTSGGTASNGGTRAVIDLYLDGAFLGG